MSSRRGREGRADGLRGRTRPQGQAAGARGASEEPVLIALLLLGCSEPEDLAATLPYPGPYGAGYVEEQVTYADPAEGGDRTLRLARWYPTLDASGTDAKYQGLFEADGVWANASEAEHVGVVVVSHGHQGYAEAQGFLMAHLASHGWLVAAPDHTGNTTFDGADRDTEIYFQRPADISAVLDHLGADSAVGMGHSFGGYTLHALMGASYDPAVMAACADDSDTSPYCSTWQDGFEDVFSAGFTDPRIVAGVPMAAGDFRLFGADGIADIEVPVLVMTGELDGATADTGQPMWDVVRGGDNVRVHILGGGHQTYTDFAGVLDDGSTIDVDEGHRIVAAYALAFARRHGLGDDAVDPVLSGEVAISGEAEVSR